MSDGEIGDILWQPSEARIAGTALAAFAQMFKLEATDYAALLAASLTDPDNFYGQLWDFLGIVGDRGGVSFVAGSDIRHDRFFPDAKLNCAENALREPDERLAIIARRDDGTRRTLTRRQLYDLVSRCAQALTGEGRLSGAV